MREACPGAGWCLSGYMDLAGGQRRLREADRQIPPCMFFGKAISVGYFGLQSLQKTGTRTTLLVLCWA